MTKLAAALSFLRGAEAHRRWAEARLAGSPFVVQLRYIGGLPGAYQPAVFQIGRMGNRLRMVDDEGVWSLDVPVERVRGISCDQDGLLKLRLEPTHGLMTTLELQVGGDAGTACRQLLQLLSMGA